MCLLGDPDMYSRILDYYFYYYYSTACRSIISCLHNKVSKMNILINGETKGPHNCVLDVVFIIANRRGGCAALSSVFHLFD